MSEASTPLYSVCVPADRPEVIEVVVSRLRQQTIADQIEMVVATPNPVAFEEMRQSETTLAAIQILEIDNLVPLGAARAAGVRAARAPFVFLGETHSFADVEDWAERLVARHQEGWGVVVPGFRNANPNGLYSWTGFLGDYGTWLAANPEGEIDYWPLNNASCTHQALMEQSDTLDHGLAYGDQLLIALAENGHRVWLEPEARLAHFNVNTTRAWLDERWVGGVLVAHNRSEDWSLARCLFYTLAAPLIGFVLFARVQAPARRMIRQFKLSPMTLPLMLVGALVQGMGEMLGYTHLGSGMRSERRMTEYEINKVRYIRHAHP